MNDNTRSFLFGLIIIFIQIGCKNQQKTTPPSFRSIPITVEDYSAIESLQIEDLALISLNSAEDYLFDQIAKILFCDGLIFIKPWNQNKILVFSESGEGLHIIDHVGKGQGEFVSISDFDIDTHRKEIIILDPGNRKVLIYTFDGTFIRDFEFNEYIKLFKTVYCADSTVAYAADVGSSNLNADGTESFSFLLLDQEFKVVEKYFPFEVPIGGFNGELSKIFSHNTVTSGYYKMYTNIIYHIDCEGMEKKYQLDFNHPVIDYQAFENLMSGSVDIDHFDYVMDVKYLESRRYLIMNYSYKRVPYMFVYDKENATGQNFKIEPKGPCRAGNRFPLLSLKQNSLVFAITAGYPVCLDLFDDIPGTKAILDQLKSREENENPSLLIATFGN